MGNSIWIGFEPRESDAFAVCRQSIRSRMTQPLPIRGVVLDNLRKNNYYWRDTEVRDGKLWDSISEAPMSTQFAISRFLVPTLAGGDWAMFMDCDILCRTNIVRLFEKLDPKYAVYCVKHNHNPDGRVKMDGQIQTKYARKNWSSVMVFNCSHESNKRLTVELVNTVPGRDLHAFCWLKDEEIGELGIEWNYLVDISPPCDNPMLVHFTEGIPSMKGYEGSPYAEEWWKELSLWAS